MSDKNDVSTSENVVLKPGKFAAIKRHFARFWWIYLIIAVLGILFIILIAIFVVVPKIAQSKLNDAKLEIKAVKISDPTPTSYRMIINSTITTDGKVKANLDPFEGVMYLADAPDRGPFATIQFPATTAKKFSVVNVDQRVQISDMNAFKEFNTWFINNETLRIGVRGTTVLQPVGLAKKYSVKFDKVLEVKGLNRFKGMEVVDSKIALKLDLDHDPNFRNFWATTKIPNPSHFSLEIGNATFNNYFLGTDVGSLHIDNLALVPGDNFVKASGNLKHTDIIALVSSHKPYCETGKAPFSLIGTNVTNHGVELNYFTNALANTNQTIQIDLQKTLQNSNLPLPISCVN